jgi:hypothetical protein
MRLVRLLGILAAQLLLVAGIHQIYFGSIVHNYSLYSLSSTFFAVGAIVFFPTFALRIGSGNLFLGFRYSMLRLFRPSATREFVTFKDYLDAKFVKYKGKMLNDVLYVAIFLIIVSFVLASRWGA